MIEKAINILRVFEKKHKIYKRINKELKSLNPENKDCFNLCDQELEKELISILDLIIEKSTGEAYLATFYISQVLEFGEGELDGVIIKNLNDLQKYIIDNYNEIYDN